MFESARVVDGLARVKCPSVVFDSVRGSDGPSRR